ncbi:hypothetical protein H0V99_03830 [Candidatus Saccharibacteria bacterium]|nr:hypothetical protein [Candidatus Saccharibacteria bacterium]
MEQNQSNDAIYSTQNVTETDNPQAATEYPGSSNASDFQSAATDEVLNQQQATDLNVTETGERVTGVNRAVDNNFSSAFMWGGIALAVLIFVILVARKLIQDEAGVSSDAVVAAPASQASTKAIAAKKPVKKTSGKKSAAGKKRKKSAKRR